MPVSAYSRTENLRALWPWLPLWLLVAMLAIFSHDPMPLYSTRTLAVAWEMWSQGYWLVPHINGQPYSEKAPLLFWLIHAVWFVFGVSDIWPRMLEVLFGGTQLVLISVLAQRLFPQRPRLARTAPWMLLALSYAFLFGLQIMYDVLLAVCTLSALLCLTPKANRIEPRWLLFGLCIGAGLLTKGPVMLLHALFPWLLGPLWSEWARQHRARWYGFGTLSVLIGGAMLLAWALPAGFSGGEAYRQRLFFTQTAGRVVKAFDHAHPWYWYVLMLPLLLCPFIGWPRAWVALAMLRRPLEPGIRFALCWLVPTFAIFSLISGKQLYYLLPEYGGAILLLASAVAILQTQHPGLGSTGWLGTWPLGIGGVLLAAFLCLLPTLLAGNHLHGEWLDAAAPYSRYFAVLFLLLGGLLFIRGRGELRRLAVASLLGTLALNALFTLTLWPRWNLRPATQLLQTADHLGQPIAYLGEYEGEFHFAGRLRHPFTILAEGKPLQDFAHAHADALIVTHPGNLDANALRYGILAQPFRSSWIVIWPATTLADIVAGRQPQEPRQPILLYPANKLGQNGAPHGR